MDPLAPDHIRLLYIEPGVDESPIRCRLVTTSLEASPPYEALSYTWGSTEKDSTITCDNVPIFVTQNLYDAIKYLRNSENERIMWIDAVCINQRNDQERTEQVGIMKVIYAKASRVVIWLGRETSEDKGAFFILSRFKELFAKYGLVEVVGPIPDTDLGFPQWSDPEWSALVRLFQREWFRRIWVVQEATVSKLRGNSLHPSSSKPAQRMLTTRNLDGT
jgi:Heterokaryon incompatibility protein (HET)